MIKYYATFYSPGTLFSETSTKELEGKDEQSRIVEAATIAKTINERYGAKPYGFSIYSQEEYEPIIQGNVKYKADPKEINRTGIYYITGEIRTAADILSGTDNSEYILRRNVEINNIKAIITNTNSYKFNGEFREKDVLIDWNGNVIDLGYNYV